MGLIYFVLNVVYLDCFICITYTLLIKMKILQSAADETEIVVVSLAMKAALEKLIWGKNK